MCHFFEHGIIRLPVKLGQILCCMLVDGDTKWMDTVAPGLVQNLASIVDAVLGSIVPVVVFRFTIGERDQELNACNCFIVIVILKGFDAI